MIFFDTCQVYTPVKCQQTWIFILYLLKQKEINQGQTENVKKNSKKPLSVQLLGQQQRKNGHQHQHIIFVA